MRIRLFHRIASQTQAKLHKARLRVPRKRQLLGFLVLHILAVTLRCHHRRKPIPRSEICGHSLLSRLVWQSNQYDAQSDQRQLNHLLVTRKQLTRQSRGLLERNPTSQCR